MNCLLATAIPKRILLRYNLTDDPLPIIVDTSRLLQLIAGPGHQRGRRHS